MWATCITQQPVGRLMLFAIIAWLASQPIGEAARADESAPPALIRTILTELDQRDKERPSVELQIASTYLWPDQEIRGDYREHGSTVTHLRTDGSRFALDSSLFRSSPSGTKELQITSHIVWNGERYFSWEDRITGEGRAFTTTDPELARNTLSDVELGFALDGRCGTFRIVSELLAADQELDGTFVNDEVFGRSIFVSAQLTSGTYEAWISTARPYFLYKYSVERSREQLDATNSRNEVSYAKEVVSIDKFDQLGAHLVPIRGTVDRYVLNKSARFDTRIVIERTGIKWINDLDNAFHPSMPISTRVMNLEALGSEGIWDGESVQFTAEPAKAK